MFRIDREFISFAGPDTSREVYTTVGVSIRAKEPGIEPGKREKVEAELRQMKEAAERHASEILAGAKEEARSIVGKAHADSKQVFEQAREKGYAEGAAKAEKELRLRSRRDAEAVKSLLKKIGDERDETIAGLEDDVVGLIFDISKKVINVQLEKDDNVFIELVHSALCKLKREGRIVIRVSPDEYGRIFSTGIAEFVVNKEAVQAETAEEPAFDRWDCVVESEGETINAGVGSQLRRIELAFRRKESADR